MDRAFSRQTGIPPRGDESSGSDGGEAPPGYLPVPAERSRRATTIAQTAARKRRPARDSPYPTRRELDSDDDALPELPRVTVPDLFDGDRGSLYFYRNVTKSMNQHVARSCVSCGTTDDLEIDHIRPFAGRIADIEEHEFCDGTTHWRAAMFDDALEIYNDGISYRDPAGGALVAGSFQWMCSTHNASKNGPKHFDAIVPREMGPCPGAPCGFRTVKRATGQRRKHL